MSASVAGNISMRPVARRCGGGGFGADVHHVGLALGVEVGEGAGAGVSGVLDVMVEGSRCTW